MTDLTGKTIGQYDIIEEIGRGGMATVYRAYQPGMEREVAIKVLPPQFTQDPTFMARFEREIQLAAKLQHPRILPVFDFGEYEDCPYYVMTYIPTRTLEDRVRHEPLSLDRAVRYVSQIAEGLDYLHSQGVIHRDLKSSNVMIDSEGQAYLADFGIAKVQEATAHLTGTHIVGTPSHMAPESFIKGEISPLVDVYALGVMFFQLVTGKLPYQADTPIQYMRAHLEDAVPDARRFAPSLPPAVQGVIETAMAKNPAQRYQSAGEFAATLQKAVWQTDIPQPETKQPDRRWLQVAGGILIMLTVVAIIIFILGSFRQSGEITPTPHAVVSSATSTSIPTPASSETPTPTRLPPPTNTSTVILSPEPIPVAGGGTGILGFNANGLGYTVDFDCILTNRPGCDPLPHILPSFGNITPSFGQWVNTDQGVNMVFEVDNTPNRKIYFVNLETKNIMLLQNFAQIESYDPALAPNGKLVAFVSQGYIPAEGANLASYLPYPFLWGYEGFPTNTLAPRRQMILTPDYHPELACGEAGCPGSIGLRPRSHPVWSPNSNLLAYLQNEGNGNNRLLVINSQIIRSTFPVDSGVMWAVPEYRRALTSVASHLQFDVIDMQWDGNTNLVFLDQAETELILYEVPVAENATAQKIISLGSTGHFDLSQDGTRLSLVRFSSDKAGLYVLDLACLKSGNCEDDLVVLVDGVDNMQPAWSPDGAFIAFIREADIYVWDTLNNTEIQVTQLGIVDPDQPQWQPSP